MKPVAAIATAVVVGRLAAVLAGVPMLSPERRALSTRIGATSHRVGSPTRLRLLALICGGLTFAVALAASTVPAVAVVPALVAALGPRAWYAHTRARERRELQASWPDGLRDIRASVSAGLSLHQALLALSRRGPEPLRRAFHMYEARSRTIGVAAALRAIQAELDDPTSDAVLEILVLAHERGGAALPAILLDLAQATDRDLEAADEATTEGLEQRINARAVFVLPWAVLLVLTSQAGPFRDFYRSASGTLVIALGSAMSLVGAIVVGHLTRAPEEPRVLGTGESP